MGAVASLQGRACTPAGVEIPRDSRVSPVSCGALEPGWLSWHGACAAGRPGFDPWALSVPTCGSACPREPGSHCPAASSAQPRAALGHPSPENSWVPARSARGNIPSRLRELSTPQIARRARPQQGRSGPG